MVFNVIYLLVLKVLHLSDMPHPNWSIEKSALTDSNLGREVYFGGFRSQCTWKIFSKLFQIERTPRARRVVPFYWHSIQKQLEIVLKETRPDVMYTHNIFPPKLYPNLEFHSSMMIMSTGQYTSRDNQKFLRTTTKILEPPVQQ